MTKVQLTFARAEKEITQKYVQTCKSLNIIPGHDLERYMSEVVRTKGLVILDAEADELIRKGTALKQEVNTKRLTLQEFYTESLIKDVLKALARKGSDGTNRQLTDDSIEYFMKKISDTHKIPATSVLTCMRQQLYNIYQDNNGELDRILRIIDRIQDSEIKVLV